MFTRIFLPFYHALEMVHMLEGEDQQGRIREDLALLCEILKEGCVRATPPMIIM